MNTQDQVNEKSIALMIKGGKISSKVLAKALTLLLKQGKKQIDKTKTQKSARASRASKTL